PAWLLGGALFVGPTLALHAEPLPELSESLFFDAMPMVLTASRVAQSPLDAPAPVTVIDREMIRASGFTEIHDVFRLVPGFLVADQPDGPPVVANHGLGDAHSRRLLVLVDGRSVYDPFWGGVDWQCLPLRLEDVERIEVVRGPNQASYGANAFQGVVNIITRSPGSDTGKGVLVSRGRRGFEDYYARMGRNDGAVDWRVSLSSHQFSNFEDRGETPSLWGETVRRKVLNAQWAYQPDLRQEWRVQVGLNHGDDVVGTTAEAHKKPYRERDADSRFFQLAWRNSYAPDSEVSLQYYHYGREQSEAYPVSDSLTAPTAWIPIERDAEMRRDDLEFQQIHRLGSQLNALWGAGLRRDEVKSDHYLYGLGTVSGHQWQVFGNLDWQLAPRWLLHAGAMVEDHYLTDTLFSPRLALNFELAPQHALRLSAGRGHRAPTVSEAGAREVYPDGTGGSADVGYWAFAPLSPERVDYRDLGYVGRFPAVHLTVDARLFIEKYDQYIDDKSCNLEAIPNQCGFSVPAGYDRPAWFGNRKAYYFYNSGDIQVHGGDLTLDWRSDLLGRFVFSAALTRIDADPETDPDAELSAPRHASSLLWNKGFAGGWGASVGFYQVGYFLWPNDGDVQPFYRRLDLRLARRLGGAGSDDELALTLRSVNDRHTEFREYLVERQAFVTLRLGW
ncbi:MAG TPA: TonB-dependent receptor, partial [Thiobacillaceae bacterium]